LPGTRGDPRFSPFYYYPFLFAGAFSSVARKDLRRLCLANRVLLEAVLLADKKIDETRPWTPWDFCLADRCVHRALEILLPLFPPEHEFWRDTDAWYLEHARAIVREQRLHRHRLCEYPQEEFFDISSGKVALLRTNLLAMGILSGRKHEWRPLMQSQDRFLVGFQCFDDLRDWKEDLRQRNYTFLLTRVLFAGGFDRQVHRAEPVPQDAVGQVLYHRAIAEDQLRLAEQCFEDALDSAEGMNVPLWIGTVRGFLHHCRTMRHDLAEIRRRTTRKPTSMTVEERIEAALGYVAGSRPCSPGFPLARSPYPFMNPSVILAPSRFVTFSMELALSPLQGLNPRLPGRLLETSRWLAGPLQTPPDSSIPAVLEESLAPIAMDREALFRLDEHLESRGHPRPHGLYLAHLLLAASRAKIRLPRLESWVAGAVRKADYALWARIPSGDPPSLSLRAGVFHPLLPLLLLCHACGPRLPRKPLHEYLLRCGRAPGAWSNPTDTALALLCLLATGYQGPELSCAAERLLQTQEADGSWPPNAVYQENGHFYGSRELTTAWSLLAWFSHRLVHPSSAAQAGPGQIRTKASPEPKIVLHAGVPERLHRYALSVLGEARKVLAPPWPGTIFLGRWPGMPPHFFLSVSGRMTTGIHLRSGPGNRPLSTGLRPLNVEILMALTTTRRGLTHGPLRDRLERIFVSGLALSACAGLFPDQAPWERLGMQRLDWTWCREHEAFLWEELRRFLLHPDPREPAFRWLLPEPTPSQDSPIPAGAALFLGEGLFRQPCDARDARRQVQEMLEKSLPDIVRTFRRKAGLDNHENTFARGLP
jgi:hypothetical protein